MVQRAAWTSLCRPLSDGDFGHDGRPAILEHAPSVGERDGLAQSDHRPEALALLLETGAAAGG